eukprot:TRINITY_DN1655_c0_g1_i1.p1 TRINITY_DN1655_c0_g1~~TRINITY_DN1655_c0_g1_i1.p1  ORF type:complete len:1032 (-),score=156.60 TRINITY_DN1655_c0_g1_i1:280-3375(-)
MEEEHLVSDAHMCDATQVVTELQSDFGTGLTAIEAERRVRLFGPNEMDDTSGSHPVKLFLSHFFNVVTLILGSVLCVSIVLRDWIEVGVVLAVIIFNGLIGFFQEYSSEKSLAALRKMAVGMATVYRDGQQRSVPLEHLVIGDIVLLKQGDIVPADLRIVRSERLEIDEALLTGETVPVTKTTDALPKGEYSVGDKLNMAFRQTAVTSGKGYGVVVRTGMQTEIGKIALQLSAQKQVLTLRHKLNKVLYSLFFAGLLLAVVVLAVNKFVITKEVLLYASSLGIAILPEGLVAVVTVTLAAGTKKMARCRAIVRRLTALETLGSITDIVSDKTGTLTEGKMMAVAMWLPNGRALDVDTRPLAIQATFVNSNNKEVIPLPELLRDPAVLYAAMVASLCNSSSATVGEGKFVCVGNPTECALAVLAHQLGRNRRYFQEYLGFASVGEWPFDSTVKRMSTGYVRRTGSTGDEEEFTMPGACAEQLRGLNSVVCVKGAADVLLPLCKYVWLPEITEPTSDPNPSLAASRHNSSILSPQWKLRCEAEVSLVRAHRQELTFEKRAEVERRVIMLASRGLRVLALAFTPDLQLLEEPLSFHRDVGEVRHTALGDIPRHEVERDLTFVGLIGIYDPPRPQSHPAVELCQRAGITVRMATGDHHETAVAIARQLGILGSKGSSQELEPLHSPNHITVTVEPSTLTGLQLDAMPLSELNARTELPLVVARCSPASKVKLVEALHARGRRVAMTGDGVNDAPAVKAADVGVAMGISGSDVTKGAADITLTDDDFSTLVTAICQGRRIFSNIQKFLVHLLSSNVADVIVLVIGLAFRDSEGNALFPMSPIEILWLNMATSSPPAIALGLDKASPAAMDQPPYTGQLFTVEVVADTLIYGAVMGILSLISFVIVVFGFGKGQTGSKCHYYSEECAVALSGRCTAFTVLYVLLLLLTYICRDSRLSLLRRDIFDNKIMNICVPAAFVVLFPLIYVPVVSRTVFQHNTITWEWGIVAVDCVIFLLFSEGYKWFKRRCFCRARKITAN